MKLKCTWTNGIIWAAITLVAGIALRFLPWNFLITQEPYPGYAHGDGVYLFSDELVWPCFGMLCVSVLFAVAMYLVMYAGYMKLAGNYPADLHGVARGKLGNPWVLPMIIMLVLDLIWAILGIIIVAAIDDIGVFSGIMYMFSEEVVADGRAMLLLIIVFLTGILFNVPMFLLGKRFFKPDLVQKNH